MMPFAWELRFGKTALAIVKIVGDNIRQSIFTTIGGVAILAILTFRGLTGKRKAAKAV